MTYPLLGEAPILMPEPARWVAEHRDSILAALVRHDLADPRTVAMVEALSAPWLDEAPDTFRDDWTSSERAGQQNFAPPLEGPASAALTALLDSAREHGLFPTLQRLVADHQPQTIVELGPGAGLLSAELARLCRRLLLLDRSFRSVLLARDRARATASAEVAAAVVDADELCLRPASADAVVSANLVDLLLEPERFLEVAAQALRPGGLLLISTPRPTLHPDCADEQLLVELVEQAGLTIHTVQDGLPWIRQHSPRECQVFLCQLIAAHQR